MCLPPETKDFISTSTLEIATTYLSRAVAAIWLSQGINQASFYWVHWVQGFHCISQEPEQQQESLVSSCWFSVVLKVEVCGLLCYVPPTQVYATSAESQLFAHEPQQVECLRASRSKCVSALMKARGDAWGYSVVWAYWLSTKHFGHSLTSWYSPTSRQPQLAMDTHLPSLRTKPASHMQPSTHWVDGCGQKMGKRSAHVGGQGGVQSE